MAWQFLGVDPATSGRECPSVYYDEATDDFLVQGWRVTDPAALAQLTMDDRETVVRIPHRLVQFFSHADRRGHA